MKLTKHYGPELLHTTGSGLTPMVKDQSSRLRSVSEETRSNNSLN